MLVFGSQVAASDDHHSPAFAGLGRLEWRPLAPPHDLPLWLPALREVLARDHAELSQQTGALAVRRVASSTEGVATACFGRGRFDQMLGACLCRSGYGGDRCERIVPERCNDDREKCVSGKITRWIGSATTGSVGQAPSCLEWTRVLSRCSAQCDVTKNRCVCGERSRYPERHMKMCEMRGIERLTPWRSSGWARFEVLQPWHLWAQANHTPPWFEEKIGREKLAALWATPAALAATAEERSLAWCDRDPGPATWQRARKLKLSSCRCYDGMGGRACHLNWLAFCVNQCSGRGECQSGFCLCQPGWSGVDCSIPLVPPAPPPSVWSVWTRSGGASGGSSWLLDWEPQQLQRRARALPPLRPSVYVYELPGEFNTKLLETRFKRDDCTYRRYVDQNATKWAGYAFGMELAVHEALLLSRHRTLDPEAADFFFVPVYGGCYISRFFRPTPAHSLFVPSEERPTWLPAPVLGNQFYRRALQWVQAHYPYWARRNGTDHIFAFPHDEGACIAPVELRHSILLSSWGRHELHPANSTTSMPEHAWFYKDFVPSMYASHRCFDPAKDILMPVFTKLDMLEKSLALRGRPDAPANASVVRGRHGWLFHFRGQVLHEPRFRHYSFGIRQQAHRLFRDREGEGLLVSDKHSRHFLAELRNATFCAVFPGNGWGHIEAPVLMGCIPVVVQDEILVPWETALDFASFGLRVPRSQLPRLPELLRAIPEEKVRALQRGLAAVWERFTYSSLARAAAARHRWHCEPPPKCAGRVGRASRACARALKRARPQRERTPEGCSDSEPQFVSDPRLTGVDAIDTMMQVLKLRLVQRNEEGALGSGAPAAEEGLEQAGPAEAAGSRTPPSERWGKGGGWRRAKRRSERVRPWRERQAREAELLLRKRKRLLGQGEAARQ